MFYSYNKSRPGIVLLCQQDPRWAELPLPPTRLTIGREGCTTTALAALTGTTPDSLSKKIRYNSEGRIIWQSVPGFVVRVRNRYDEERIKEWYSIPTNIALIEVNHSHWIALDRFSPFGFGPLGMDPWDGTWIKIVKKYKNITGYALIARK